MIFKVFLDNLGIVPYDIKWRKALERRMGISRKLKIFLMAACVLMTVPSLSNAGVAEGNALFAAKKCASCHQIEGPAREKTIADQLAKKGPELWYAGSKFRDGFLERWLADPRPIRPLKYNSLTEPNASDHPALAPAEAADVARYLMTLKSGASKPSGVAARAVPLGRIIFLKRQSCYGCHTVLNRGNVAGGLSGPTLIGASRRLNPDWVYAFLSNPKVFKPVKDMPDYAGILDDAEIKALSGYVCSLD